jgi:hypothetical protein
LDIFGQSSEIKNTFFHLRETNTSLLLFTCSPPLPSLGFPRFPLFSSPLHTPGLFRRWRGRSSRPCASNPEVLPVRQNGRPPLGFAGGVVCGGQRGVVGWLVGWFVTKEERDDLLTTPHQVCYSRPSSTPSLLLLLEKFFAFVAACLGKVSLCTLSALSALLSPFTFRSEADFIMQDRVVALEPQPAIHTPWNGKYPTVQDGLLFLSRPGTARHGEWHEARSEA